MAEWRASGKTYSAIQGQSSGTVEEEHDGDAEERESVLRAGVAVVTGDQEDGSKHIAGDHEGGKAGEEAEDQENAANELCERRDIAEPIGYAERGDKVAMVLERGKGVAVEAPCGDDLAVAVRDHGYAEHETQKKCSPGLETVERFGHKLKFLNMRVTCGAVGQCGFWVEGAGVGTSCDAGAEGMYSSRKRVRDWA
jgi:hypothetical protein